MQGTLDPANATGCHLKHSIAIFSNVLPRPANKFQRRLRTLASEHVDNCNIATNVDLPRHRRGNHLLTGCLLQQNLSPQSAVLQEQIHQTMRDSHSSKPESENLLRRYGWHFNLVAFVLERRNVQFLNCGL